MSSGFITEAEIEERKKVRQEEWEKVRRPDQPLEAPEEAYDPRSLYERLQEQKQKKDLEYEEAHRLKNMIKGLDDDEVEFLDLVDRSKFEEERKKSAEEAREMAEFRSKVADLQEQSLEMRLEREIRRPASSSTSANKSALPGQSLSSQSKLLAGAVVRKRSSEPQETSTPPQKRKKHDSEESTTPKRESPDTSDKVCNHVNNGLEKTETPVRTVNHHLGEKVGSLVCVGILPGLGPYAGYSSDEVDSDESTDLDDDLPRYDLVGRKIKKCSSSE